MLQRFVCTSNKDHVLVVVGRQFYRSKDPTNSILLCCCHLGLQLLSVFVRRLISNVAQPIVTKLCHMFDGVQDLYKSGQKSGAPPGTMAPAQTHQNFVAISDNFERISPERNKISSNIANGDQFCTCVICVGYAETGELWSTNGEK